MHNNLHSLIYMCSTIIANILCPHHSFLYLKLKCPISLYQEVPPYYTSEQDPPKFLVSQQVVVGVKIAGGREYITRTNERLSHPPVFVLGASHHWLSSCGASPRPVYCSAIHCKGILRWAERDWTDQYERGLPWFDGLTRHTKHQQQSKEELNGHWI